MPGYLIEYNRRTGTVNVEDFESLRAATVERLKRDRVNTDEDLELVTVASRSEDQLKKSHSRYFVASAAH
ncbi:MAG: hypothetical protein Q4F10_11805 [Corynebacterium glutamicum]|nr:hypothetical protein [Corynebacterium glutamicum]